MADPHSLLGQEVDLQYEYKIEHFAHAEFPKAEVNWQDLEDRLNELGREGWEIQAIQPRALGESEYGVIVFLKRQVSQ